MGNQPRVLCFDMGGKRIRAAVATRDGLLETVAEDLPDVCDNPALNAIGERLGDQVLGQSGTRREDLLGIGFGAAGEWEGLIIRWSPNNPVRDNIAVCKHVSEYYGRQRQTLGANDLKAAVHAVPLYGHGRNRQEKDRLIVCAITYSDGNNIAILNRNQPYPGYSDLSQEVGHAHIEHGDHARWCGCGARGCFEAYVSGTAAAHMAIEALLARRNKLGDEPIFQIARKALEEKKGPLSPEAVLLGVRAEHVYAALAQGDPIAQGIRQTQRYYIGQQLAHVCLHHRPQLIELFGGLTNQRELFQDAIDDLRQFPARYSSPSFVPAEVIKITDLGDTIGLHGAAAMVLLAHEAKRLPPRP